MTSALDDPAQRLASATDASPVDDTRRSSGTKLGFHARIVASA